MMRTSPVILSIQIFIPRPSGYCGAHIRMRHRGTKYADTISKADIAALVDFYLWGYDYGHNLDPNAAIVVPGMAYQPPVIGTKQLLNFTAFSGPDIGGWIFIAAGGIAMGALIYDIYKSRKRA